MKLSSINPTHKANLSKSGFDMSHDNKFTSSVGQLLPVIYDFLYAGDKIRISEQMLTRTNTLSTAAFVNIKEHIEYFFVPMQQLFQLYPQWRFSVGEPISNVFNKADASLLFPHVPASLFNDCYARGGNDRPYLMTEGDDMGYPYSFKVSTGFSRHFEKAYEWGMMRLLNMFNINVFTNPQYDTSVYYASNFPVNVAFLAAYQKIFFDYYSIDDRVPYDNIAFSLDAWYLLNFSATSLISTNTKAESMAGAMSHMCQLRYVPWKKDYFMGMMVSPLETSSSLNTFYGGNLTEITDFISKISPELLSASTTSPTGEFGDNPPTQVTTMSASGTIGNNVIQSRISTGAIRKMFALEKFLSITRRAQDDYKSQVAAHFGQDISDVLSNRVIYLGGTSNQIFINEATGTVNNDNTAIGEIAGKGIGSSSNKKDTVRFTAPCDGIMIGMYYARPEIDYRQNALDKLHTWVRPSELYTPEYANLGEQPVFAYELLFDIYSDEYNPYGVLGWQFRYQQFKQKVNRVHTGFCTDGLSDWTIAANFDNYAFAGHTEDFYVNPSALDSIMLTPYKGGSVQSHEWNFGYDPLLHWFHFNYYKVSVMDKFGLPSL